jgi:hypothetical protein
MTISSFNVTLSYHTAFRTNPILVGGTAAKPDRDANAGRNALIS